MSRKDQLRPWLWASRAASYLHCMTDQWTQSGKVRARITDDRALELFCAGLTTQAKYYKERLRTFFRKEFQRIRPGYGEYSVHIRMEYVRDPPRMDLDNIAKALLDAVKGHAFEDDSQVARLLVERREGEREGVWLRVEAMD